MLLARSSPCTFPVLLLDVESLDIVGLFSVKVVVTSTLSLVEPLPSDEPSSLLVSVEPLPSDEPSSLLVSVEPLPSDEPSSLLVSVDPLAYMIAEAGKII